jgi:hypothetical protein
MPSLELQDGRVIEAPPGAELSPDQWDVVGDMVESGSKLPAGWTVRPAPQVLAQAPADQGMLSQVGQRVAGAFGQGGPGVKEQVEQLQQQAWEGYKARVQQPVVDIVTQTTRNPQGEVISTAERTDTPVQVFQRDVDIAKGLAPEQAQVNMMARIDAGLDAARYVGEVLVPENLADAASMAAVIARAGIPGVAGVALRAAAAPIADMVARAAAGQPQDLTTALIKGVGSLSGDTVGKVVQYVKSPAFRQAAKVRLGDDLVEQTGRYLETKTGIQGVRKPADLQRLVDSDFGVDASTGWREASKRIGQAQEQIERSLNPAMAAMDPARRQTAQELLVKAAGGDRGPMLLPDTLFKKALQRAREAFQSANRLEGPERHAAMEEYGKLRQGIETALRAVSTDMGDAYDAMNKRFHHETDFLTWLYKHRTQLFKSDGERTVFDSRKFQEAVKGARADFRKMDLDGIPYSIAPRGGPIDAMDREIDPQLLVRGLAVAGAVSGYAPWWTAGLALSPMGRVIPKAVIPAGAAGYQGMGPVPTALVQALANQITPMDSEGAR